MMCERTIQGSKNISPVHPLREAQASRIPVMSLTMSVSHHFELGFAREDVLQSQARVTVRLSRTTKGFVVSFLRNRSGCNTMTLNCEWQACSRVFSEFSAPKSEHSRLC